MSSGTCGLSSSSSSIFGGLCSGNSRRPSMFTAKYRLREERKKVLKMSMAKVKRIEDPESFLRRSVLINNTIKRLQREVREEKMMRHGGYSKFSCSTLRKSYACSRLSDMHLQDEDALSMSSSRHYSSSHNSRKRPLSDEGDDDCDVQAVLSQIYIPPTPCIISSIDEDECPESSSSGSVPAKRSKLDLSSVAADDDPTTALLVVDECSLEVDVDVDVDVVGDSETSDWPTPPEPQSEMIIVTPSIIDSSVNGSIESAMDSMESLSGASVTGTIVPDDDTVVVVDDCEFSLDLPPSPLGSTSVDETVEVLQVSSSHHHHSSSNSQVVMEDMTTSEEDTKENTCTLQIPSTSCSTPDLLIPSTLDRKCAAPINQCTGIPSATTNNFITSTDLSSASRTNFSSSPNSSSSAPIPSSTTTDKQQYSSCGHSSIFGELQSVVFHSLIASLET